MCHAVGHGGPVVSAARSACACEAASALTPLCLASHETTAKGSLRPAARCSSPCGSAPRPRHGTLSSCTRAPGTAATAERGRTVAHRRAPIPPASRSAPFCVRRSVTPLQGVCAAQRLLGTGAAVPLGVPYIAAEPASVGPALPRGSREHGLCLGRATIQALARGAQAPLAGPRPSSAASDPSRPGRRRNGPRRHVSAKQGQSPSYPACGLCSQSRSQQRRAVTPAALNPPQPWRWQQAAVWSRFESDLLTPVHVEFVCHR